mmetsp:Transcript_2096/g.6233  ORF Transcript_2096/g.6233 Transcript_2096/m.6233 type:complete len:268 (+) Transcript_2096:167-970(+)
MIRLKRSLGILNFVIAMLATQPRLLSAWEAPESMHRRACVPFPRERLMQRMWAEASMGHRLPLRADCSSLEGASCVYEVRPRPNEASAMDAVSNGETGAASKKIKVILFGQKDAKTVQDIVKALAEKGAGESMAAGLERDEVLEREARKLLDQRGGVVFETDSQGGADVEAIAEHMAKSFNLPQGTVASLEKQLAQALTDAEFANERKAGSIISVKDSSASKDEDSLDASVGNRGSVSSSSSSRSSSNSSSSNVSSNHHMPSRRGRP